MYTYLDSEAHVRVSLGCDLIMEGVQQNFSGKTMLAWIGSPTIPTGITKHMYDMVPVRRAGSGSRRTG